MADTEDLDAELQNLLADLDQQAQPEPEPAPVQAVAACSVEPIVPELSELPVVIDEPVADIVAVAQSNPSNPIDLALVIQRFDKDYNSVQANLQADRGKIDGVVGILLARVQAGTASNTEVESLVKALDVLANTNGHHVKLLDSRSKLLAASKNAQAFIQQNFGNTENPELLKLLEQPEDDV